MTKEASDETQKHGKWGTFVVVVGAIAGLITALTGLLKACTSTDNVPPGVTSIVVSPPTAGPSSTAEAVGTLENKAPEQQLAVKKCRDTGFRSFLASGLRPNSFTYIGNLVEAKVPIVPSGNAVCKEAVEVALEIQELAKGVDADIKSGIGGRLSAFGQGQHDKAMRLQARLKELTD